MPSWHSARVFFQIDQGFQKYIASTNVHNNMQALSPESSKILLQKPITKVQVMNFPLQVSQCGFCAVDV